MSERDGVARSGSTRSSRRGDAPPVGRDEISRQIHRLQEEICEREERISRLVDAVERPTPLSDHMEDGDRRRRIEHLERMITDWDTLVARSRAVSEDDIDMIAALTRFVAKLLAEQPEGIDERWIFKLREYLAEQRAKVS